MATVGWKSTMKVILGLSLMTLTLTWWSYKESGKKGPIAHGISQSVGSLRVQQHDVGTRFE